MPPDKAQLEEMYLNRQMTMQAVAQEVQIHIKTLRKWLIKYDIPLRAYQTPDKWNARKEEIEFLYHHLRLSQDQIAIYYGSTQSQIYRVMKRLAIPRLSKGRRKGADHYLWKGGKHNRDYRKLIVKNECARCQGTEHLGIHHKNNDHYDNRLENLEVLCNSCHMSETKTAWWAAKKAGKKYKGNALVGWDHTPQSPQSPS